jgi:hypothetical protein
MAVRFLKRLQDLARPAAGLGTRGGRAAYFRRERVSQGVARLDAGFDRLAATLAAGAMRRDEALLVESILLARLLAEHRPHAVRFALLAAGRAIARPDYRIGDVIVVPSTEADEAPALRAAS